MATHSAEQSHLKNCDSGNLPSREVIIELTVHEPSNNTLLADTETPNNVAGDVDFRVDKYAPPMFRCRKRPRYEPDMVVKFSNSFFNQDFPTRLWKIVDSDLFKSATWDKNGIHMLLDEELFITEVLQRKSIRPTLSCLNLTEFEQQLRLHGFQKLTSVAPNSKLSMYYHHSFRQHQEKLLRNIKVQVFEADEKEVDKEKLEEEDEDVMIIGVIPAPPRHPGPPPPNTPSVPGKGETWAVQTEEVDLLRANKDLVAKISSVVHLMTPSAANAPPDTTPIPAPTPATSSITSSHVTFVAGASLPCARSNIAEQNVSRSNNTTAHHGWVRVKHNQSCQVSEPALGRSLTTCPHSSVAHSEVFPPSTYHQLGVSQVQFKEAADQAHQVPKVLFPAQQTKQVQQFQTNQAQLPQSHPIQQAQQTQAQHFQLAQARQAQQSQAQALYQQMVQAQIAWMHGATYNPWVLQALQIQTAAYMFPHTQCLHRPPGGISTDHHIHPVFHTRGSSRVAEATRLRPESRRYSPDLTSLPPSQSYSQ
ncbi:uncharacterized protein LOC105027662 [Esox lucius]|uniref:uncharacterized protein LOC105027662 n=1 Tax=Esox lucius TaxID=8010 RepID=UPI0014773793|nr:uncharacterized protein LOC105027662 [Esox lucius]